MRLVKLFGVVGKNPNQEFADKEIKKYVQTGNKIRFHPVADRGVAK
jgi:hypothetical protein